MLSCKCAQRQLAASERKMVFFSRVSRVVGLGGEMGGGEEEERAGPTSDDFHTRRWNPASAAVEAQLLS